MTGDGIPDLLVSNSQSNNVMLLPGVGGGFFNDQNPRIISLPSQPGPMYPFGPDVVVLNPGSNTVTLISDFMGTSPLTRTFGSGGFDPVAAFEFSSDNGFDNLIVANNDDGHVALLEGRPEGLILDRPTSSGCQPDRPGLLELSPEARSQFYAATEGSEAATLLTFQLGGETAACPRSPGCNPCATRRCP